MPDMYDDFLTRMRAGTAAPAVAVVPTPKADMFDEYIAKFRPEALADALGKKATPAKSYAERVKDSPGQVVETPGYGTGESILNGLLQGFYPQAFAAGSSLFGKDYSKSLAEKEISKKQFSEQNPGMSAATEITGSVASLLPMMALGQEYMAAPAGRMLATALPRAGTAIADFLGGASTGALKVPSLAARGAIEGATGATIASGLSDKPLAEQAKTGAILGAGLNPVLNIAGAKLSSKINPTSVESAQALIDQGIPVRAGQIPGASPITAGLDKVFSRGKNAKQNEAFSEALTEHAGLPAKNIDQKWVSANDTRIGTTMNNIQSVYTIPALETGLVNDLAAIRANATANMSVQNAAKVDDMVNKLEQNVLNPMNGKIYQNITQKNGILDNFSKDKDIGSAVQQAREALDSAWGRALPADKKAAWDQARREYKITRTIDDSMGATGAAEGEYNPKRLLAAVERRFGNTANAGELGDLARGGQFLKAPGEGFLHGHSPYKLPLQVGMGIAGGAAVTEGVKRASHYAPEFLAQMAHDPATYVGPAIGAGAAVGGGSILNWLLNRPAATQHLLDVTMGKASPILRGVNPALPFLVEGYNRQ